MKYSQTQAMAFPLTHNNKPANCRVEYCVRYFFRRFETRLTGLEFTAHWTNPKHFEDLLYGALLVVSP